MPRGRRTQARLLSARIVGFYLLLSLVWIRFSDLIAERITDDPAELTRIQTVKGWLFILVTALLLYLLIARALNESRTVTQGLARRESELELILKQIPAILWTTDNDLVTTSVVGRGLQAVGKENDWAVGIPLLETVLPDVQARMASSIEAAQRGEESTYATAWEGREYRTTVAPLRGAAGEMTGLVALSVDITDQVAAERSLEHSVEALEKLNLQRDRLVHHLVKAEQEERDRIGKGIHDESIQKITSAAMALDLMELKVEGDEIRTLIERSRTQLSEAISSLRRLVFDLKPLELENDRVAMALSLLLERSSAEDGFAFEVEDRVQTLPPSTRHVIYGIAQEAIMNARKHARPCRMHISLEDKDAGVLVSIRDDGPGFDPEAPSDPYHFGIRNMKERAEVVGGWCEISSELGKGTTVSFWVPEESGPAPGGGGDD